MFMAYIPRPTRPTVAPKTLASTKPNLQTILPLFFQLVKTMITIGVFDVTTGGEITPISRNGQEVKVHLPRRITSLYKEYLSNLDIISEYQYGIADLSHFTDAFNHGHQDTNALSGLASFFSRQSVMAQLATCVEKFGELYVHSDSTTASKAAGVIAQWIDTTFDIRFVESDIVDLTKDETTTNNYKALRQLNEVHLNPTTPLELTFERICNAKNLVIALATALAMNMPIRTLTFIDCTLDDQDRELLHTALQQNTTLEQLSLQHIEESYTIVPQFRSLTDPSIMTLNFITLTRLPASTDVAPSSSSSDTPSPLPSLVLTSSSSSSSSSSSASLSEIIPNSDSYTLSIAGSNIGDDHAIELVKTLLNGQLPTITQLDLRGCGIDEAGAQMLLTLLLAKRGELALQSSSSTSPAVSFPLTRLHLDEKNVPRDAAGERNCINPETLARIAAAVANTPYTPPTSLVNMHLHSSLSLGRLEMPSTPEHNNDQDPTAIDLTNSLQP